MRIAGKIIISEEYCLIEPFLHMFLQARRENRHTPHHISKAQVTKEPGSIFS